MGSPNVLQAAMVMLSCMTAVSAMAGEREIITNIEVYFETGDAAERAEIARAIEADPVYDRGKVSDWLHAADVREPAWRGERKINVPLGDGQFRTVLVRTPPDYTPEKAWPMIIMFHGSFAGVGEDWSLKVLKRILGERIDEFIVACPGNFREDVIDSTSPASVEHPAVLLALKRALNVDSDRVYDFGISMGGYCCWTVATLYADQFAGAIPMSTTYSIPSYVDGFWETMITNVRHLPVVNVWGANDANRTTQVHGVPADSSVPGLNQRFMSLTSRLGLDNITFHEIPDRGHFPAFPPPDLLDAILKARRVQVPNEVLHRFRYIYQSSAYWLEGHTWVGEQWLSDALLFIELRQMDEAQRKRKGRWILDCLGELGGRHDGQHFEITRTHVGEMTMWIADGMIDWSAPITVRVDDQVAFDGAVEPDLDVCLSQAARTFDFDRLRWAGLRIDETGRAAPVTGRTYFPALFEVEEYAREGGRDDD